MNKKELVRPKGDKFFILVDQRIQVFLGKKVKMGHYLECDKDGNIGDGNKDGILESETIECSVPKGKEDIDLTTLSKDCLNNK